MKVFQSAALAITLCAAAASATASLPGPSIWELNNRTASNPGIHTLAEATKVISFCGVDLRGGDIWNARHPGPDACVANCLASTGCDAATWTKYEGGTCWFKRLNGGWENSVPSVGAVSFVRVSGNPGRAPRFPANVDMPGNDIQYAQVDSPLECSVVCNMNPFCFAFSWTSGFATGNCYLKSQASPYVSKPGVHSEYSGRVTNPDTCPH
jgi:hypothetical protein